MRPAHTKHTAEAPLKAVANFPRFQAPEMVSSRKRGKFATAFNGASPVAIRVFCNSKNVL